MKWTNDTPPMVCATLLTADRQAYTERAIECFLAQTYEYKTLLVLDNGREPFKVNPTMFAKVRDANVIFVHVVRSSTDTIGSLRNLAGELANGAHILMHWDSDDWSAPHRMDVQVTQLMAAGLLEEPREVVGFSVMPFYDRKDGSAWLYKSNSYALGTSLCYWRDFWAQHHFPNKSVGEDTAWYQQCGVKVAVSTACLLKEPLMIAERHDGNMSKPGPVEFDMRGQRNKDWSRLSPETAGLFELLLGYE